jgi:hypothetical protein
MPNNLNYFSLLSFTEFLVWILSNFLWKKNNIYNSIKLFLSKKNSTPLHKTTTILLLKTVRQKTRSQDCETNKFFFLHIRWRIATTGKTEFGLSFFILKLYWKQNKKQKLYLLKNDILLSDLLLRYYHRLKQTNVKKQTKAK